MGRDIRPGVEKPLWSLSSYGPAKLEPNLISGLDVSFEELRINAVMALQNNTVAEYVRRHSFRIFHSSGRLVERKDRV
jgi:nucleoporin NUP42